MDRDRTREDPTGYTAPGELTRRDALAVLAGGLLVPSLVAASRPAPVPSSPGGIDGALHYASLADVAQLLETGKLSPTDLTRQLLDRIAAVDGTLRSYVTVLADTAMESARRAESEIRAGRYRGPLHGVPIAVKDLCYTRGVRTMAGTKVLSDFVPDFDATVVARLESAGAVLLGKLALCEVAFGPYHPGLQVPVNPWDATRWSGVSSSGSGVATAAGLCFAAVGTDTGGSIRYPSAVNGCVGLKPTYGRVSRCGVFGLAASMDHVGPMARTVEDAAILFEAMAGFDANDPTSLSDAVPKVRAELARGVAGLRLGFDRRYATENVEPEVARAVEGVLAALRQSGARVVEVEMPDVGESGAMWFDLCAVEAVLANAATWPSRAGEYGPDVRDFLQHGSQLTGVSHARTSLRRAELAARIERMLGGVDCMVCPTMASVPPVKSANPYELSEEEWNRLVPNDVYAKPFNFSGSPTLSVPCGFSAEGLPLSVQFVGRRSSEAVLCRVGHAFERVTDWHLRRPPV